MRKTPILLGLSLIALVSSATTASAQNLTLATDLIVADAVVTVYDPETGRIAFNGNGLSISSYSLTSASGILPHGRPQ